MLKLVPFMYDMRGVICNDEEGGYVCDASSKATIVQIRIEYHEKTYLA